MPTKFSDFNDGGAVSQIGDTVVGLRGGANTIFNAQAFAALPWTTVTAGQVLVINNGYFFANSGNAVYTLPAVAALGQILQFINLSNHNITIAQNAGQQIQFGNIATTIGIGGSILSANIGDAITLVCSVANNNFTLLGAPQGNWVVT